MSYNSSMGSSQFMTKLMLALGFKQCKSNAGMYYYHDKKTGVLVIAIVYVDDVCFMGICHKLPFEP